MFSSWHNIPACTATPFVHHVKGSGRHPGGSALQHEEGLVHSWGQSIRLRLISADEEPGLQHRHTFCSAPGPHTGPPTHRAPSWCKKCKNSVFCLYPGSAPMCPSAFPSLILIFLTEWQRITLDIKFFILLITKKLHDTSKIGVIDLEIELWV